MIDYDLLNLESLARAFEYFSGNMDAGERQRVHTEPLATRRADPVPRGRALVLSEPGACLAEPGLTLALGAVQPWLALRPAPAEYGSCSTVLFSHQ